LPEGRIIGVKMWIGIVIISVLIIILLGIPACMKSAAQENRTTGVYEEIGLYQRTDQPAADSDGIQASQVFVSGQSVSGVPIFPSDHIWNTRADSLPVDSRSADYIGKIGSTAYLHADFGSGIYDGNLIGIPYNIVNWSQEKRAVFFDYADESDDGPYPIPDNPLI
jgi:hypothetical protein